MQQLKNNQSNHAFGNGLRKIMENQPELRPDIYLIVLRSTIVLVLEHHSNLFDEDSLRQLSSILTLDDKSLTLLSRSLSRKYSWLRVDSVAAYLPSQPDLEEALNVLIDTNALQLLQPDSKFPLDDLWPACSSLNVDELKVFSGFITNSLTKCNYGQEKTHLTLIPDKTKDLLITVRYNKFSISSHFLGKKGLCYSS